MESASDHPVVTSLRASGWRRRFFKLSGGYAAVAVLVLNSVVVYVLLNLILGLGFAVRDLFRKPSNPVSVEYGDRLNAVYPDMSENDRTQMLSEAWNRPYRYADFIHFQERPIQGRYVNVDTEGFRVSRDQGPWPPHRDHFNVFCFGGSTTFGYGVADDQTVASFVQQRLASLLQRRVCVYNFGVGWHFSTQERLRFELLLAQGIIPNVALFLDGINDTTQAGVNRPAFSEQLEGAFEQSQGFGFQSPSTGSGLRSLALMDLLVHRWPVGRLIRGISTPRRSKAAAIPVLDEIQAKRSCAVYRWNRELIASAAKARGVMPLFVVQPAPGYQLDLSKHLFANRELCQNEALYYKILQEDVRANPDTHLIWCADLVTSTPGPLYVDTCHYTAQFSRVIADDIVKKAAAKGLWEAATRNK